MWTEKGEGDVSLGVISRKEEGRDSVDREGGGRCLTGSNQQERALG